MTNILEQLGLGSVNAGTWSGTESWETDSAPLIESVNPSNGELIASVRQTTVDEYNKVIANAKAAYLEWRKVPAPARGEAVRLIGQALRDNKDALGSLVTLEMGKIKVEGDGEVQEMIDIAASHVRAMAPAGRRRNHHGIQFPGRCLVVECLHRRHMRQRQYLEAITENAALRRGRAEDLQRGAGRCRAAAGVSSDQRWGQRARTAVRR